MRSLQHLFVLFDCWIVTDVCSLSPYSAMGTYTSPTTSTRYQELSVHGRCVHHCEHAHSDNKCTVHASWMEGTTLSVL